MSSPSIHGEQPARWASGPVLVIALLVGLAFALAVLLGTYPGSTHFDTAEIHMWSRLGFVLNTGRHPPLLPWLVHAVDLMVPLGQHGLLGLAFFNMLLGAYAVWRIARLVVGVERAALALALYGLLPYGTWLALKLNHNAILMSLWPLTVWAFLACLRRPTLVRGVLLGIAAAAGVLAKYYTGLLLVAMLVVTLWRTGSAQFYRAPGPWIALGVLGALVAPHLYVSYLADSAAFATLFDDAGYLRPNPLVHALQPAADDGLSLVRMLRAGMLALAPMLAGFGFLLWWQRTSEGAGPAVVRDRGDGSFGVVCLLVAIPLVLTVGIAAALRLPASANWTSPVFTLLPVALAGLLAPPSRPLRTVLLRCAGAACVALPLSGPVLLYFNFKSGSRAVVAPNAEIARDAVAVWSAATGRRAEILMGNQAIANIGTLELPWRPISWPGFDLKGSPISPEMIAREGILGMCTSVEKTCNEQAMAVRAASGGFVCRLRNTRTLWGLRGPEHVTHVYLLSPGNRPFTPKDAERACRDVVFWP